MIKTVLAAVTLLNIYSKPTQMNKIVNKWDNVMHKYEAFESVLTPNKSNDWEEYIPQTIASLIHHTGGGPRDLWLMFTTFTWLQTNDKNTTVFTLPYHDWIFEPLAHVAINWTIHVHVHFAINLTIWKAYVPYARDCNVGVISFHDINLQKGISGLWWGCGHMVMDTSYSEHNVAMVEFALNTTMLPYPAFINASYQVVQAGLAYTFSEPFVPRGWEVDIKPNVVCYNTGQWMFTWYLSNQIINVSSLNIVNINITSFTCSLNGSLLVFPGLLTSHQIKLSSRPLSIIHCDRHDAWSNVALNAHMYATLVVSIHASDQHTLLNLTLYMKRVAPLRLRFTRDTVLSAASLPVYRTQNGSQLSMFLLPPSVASLKFLQFVADTIHINMKLSQMSFAKTSEESSTGKCQ